MLIEPKDIEIVSEQSGDTKSFVISKVPAIPMYKIVAKLPTTAIPKIGDFDEHEQTYMKLLSYAAVRNGENLLPLKTEQLINAHTGDWEVMGKLIAAMLENNVSFFANGKTSTFLAESITQVIALITKTLTDSLAQSSQKD